jgi:hypothetical protein
MTAALPTRLLASDCEAEEVAGLVLAGADDLANGYGQHLTAPERETVVNLNDAEGVCYVYSSQRPIINRLRKHPAARLVEEGVFGSSVWARFELPAEFVTFRLPRAKRELTEEQRDAFRDRMARSRGNGTPPERPRDDE